MDVYSKMESLLPTLNILLEQLNNYLQIPLFEDYGPNGLQVEGKKTIQRIATAVTASLKVIDEAIRLNADALIVHHGIFWFKDSPVLQGVKREKLAKLLGGGVSLIAYHLPLDAHREIGNNWKAAIDLGWTDLEPFYKAGRQWIGVKGRVQTRSRKQLQDELENYYGQKAVLALGGPEFVSTVALVSGGAYRQIEEAAKEGIDCYISGNLDEPAWHMAHEEKVNFFALGHAATEKVGPRALAHYIDNTFGIEAFFIDEQNPF